MFLIFLFIKLIIWVPLSIGLMNVLNDGQAMIDSFFDVFSLLSYIIK